MNNKYHLIRKIYLYTFSLVGLVLVVIGGVRLVGLGLKTFVFTKITAMIMLKTMIAMSCNKKLFLRLFVLILVNLQWIRSIL